MKTELLNISRARLKRWARLDDNKFRQAEGIFLAEGVKVVEELLSSDWPTEAILVLPEKIKYWEKLTAKADNNIPVYSIDGADWKKLSQDKEPEGIMALAAKPARQKLADFLASASDNILILYEISNPGNLGALLRSALWFGFNNIVLSAGSTDYTHPKAVRASMGSIFHLNLITDVSLKKVLPEIKKSYYLVGSDVRDGKSPHFLSKKSALLLGSESHGLPEDLLAEADEQWSIPGNGKVDSLSLPQAAAIMMYECAKKE